MYCYLFSQVIVRFDSGHEEAFSTVILAQSLEWDFFSFLIYQKHYLLSCRFIHILIRFIFDFPARRGVSFRGFYLLRILGLVLVVFSFLFPGSKRGTVTRATTPALRNMAQLGSAHALPVCTICLEVH